MSSENSIVEKTSLLDLEEINKEAEKYEIDLILIGGNSVRAYTESRSWRFTKDLDFITTSAKLGLLYGVLNNLGYTTMKTDYGLKGSKKINEKYSIELHISVDKVIDWSTGETYILPEDIFELSKSVPVNASFEENQDLEVVAKTAPIEDVVIMKLMTARPRDHFDSVAIILDSFDKLDKSRFKRICEKNELVKTIKERIESLIVDNRRGVIAKLWKENTGLTFIAARQNDLRKKLRALLEIL